MLIKSKNHPDFLKTRFSSAGFYCIQNKSEAAVDVEVFLHNKSCTDEQDIDCYWESMCSTQYLMKTSSSISLIEPIPLNIYQMFNYF